MPISPMSSTDKEMSAAEPRASLEKGITESVSPDLPLQPKQPKAEDVRRKLNENILGPTKLRFFYAANCWCVFLILMHEFVWPRICLGGIVITWCTIKNYLLYSCMVGIILLG